MNVQSTRKIFLTKPRDLKIHNRKTDREILKTLLYGKIYPKQINIQEEKYLWYRWKIKANYLGLPQPKLKINKLINF